jgi:WD40 repeat protein
MRSGEATTARSLQGAVVIGRHFPLGCHDVAGRRDDSAATQPPTASTGEDTLTRETLSDGSPSLRASDMRALALAQVRDPKRYLILGEHGRGGLGRVSRAHDQELGRDVAIKELISRGHVSEIRFLREALITARLEHPGIVAVHEAGRWPDGTPFYAMKLVSGRSLRELVAERPTAGERLGLLHHVIAVADAIAYAHGRHIVHRDLKPANVVVGDFGETVVIDWGLAKDLTAIDELETPAGPVQIHRDSELTVEGSVLGTPAYMAPEQERGEQVDQRADVFAIGAMLWELCALRRVPPAEVHQRRRILRRAGIDRDLATIIDKALDPDPARRYPDAGALATDLKAFKSGARIAARHYTLLAMLAHWIRRRRALALSVTAALVLAAAGTVLFVGNIAAERDRADTALARAWAANNDLTLEHAALLLHTDPTAAVATLGDYRGGDAVRRRRLIAEARGRGVARAIYTPHSDTIWFLHGDRTGAIVSVGEDRRIQLTQGATSTTLATDVSTSVRVAYAPARRLLAYATSPAGIAVLDLGTRASQRIGTLDPAVMAFAPDGARLAALDAHGELVVWPTAPAGAPIYRATLAGATGFRFATPTRLIVQERGAIRAVALDATGGAPDTRAIPDITALDAQPDAVAAGTEDGSIAMLSPGLAILGRTSVCHERLRDVRFIPHTDRIAFSCQDAVSGIARYDATRSTLTVIDSFATRGLANVEPEVTGRYVIVTDESNTTYLYDTETRLLSHYDGSSGQPSYVAAPTPELDRVLIGDVNGTVRVWDRPPGAARVILQAPAAVYGLAFMPDGQALVTYGTDGVVRRVAVGDGATTELRGHRASVFALRVAPDGSSILSVGYDGGVRAWRTSDATMSRRFAEHGGLVEDLDYVEQGRQVVSVGDDGRLLAWSPEGTEVAVLFKHTAPLTGLEVLRRNDHVVIMDAKGTVWDVSLRGEARKIREPDGAALTMLRASADGTYVAIGTETGAVAVYETSTWRVVKAVNGEGSIRKILFDPMNRDLLIAREAGHAQFGHVQLVALDLERGVPWHDVTAAVRDVAYAPDGATMGFVCADGGTWLYAVRNDTWAYARDHDTDVFTGRFSPDGSMFATTDRRGVVVVRDVASTLAAAAN